VLMSTRFFLAHAQPPELVPPAKVRLHPQRHHPSPWVNWHVENQPAVSQSAIKAGLLLSKLNAPYVRMELPRYLRRKAPGPDSLPKMFFLVFVADLAA